MLTKTQVNKIQKAVANKTGADIKISKTQIRKSVKQGGSLFSSLAVLGAKALPYVTKAASKALPALATGAVSALGSLGVNKIFGKKGVFLIPQNKIDQLIKHKGWFTEGQKKTDFIGGSVGWTTRDHANSKATRRILGFTNLASIGIPLALEMGSKLFGKGLTVPKKAGGGLMVGPKPGMVPYHPPPFYGSWEGRGKKKGRGIMLGPNSPSNNIPLLGAIL